MAHRYELEKYKGIRSRYECPACHRKRVFARYVDTWTGKYLSPDVGRCNREDNCGYHYTPKEYDHDHPENDFSEIRQDNFGKGRKGYDTKVTPRGKTSQPQRKDCVPEIYIPK